jgi:hypothetical protein
VRIGIRKKNKGQKCAETTMKNGRADRGNGGSSTFVPGSSFGHKSVSDMGSVIDAKSDRQHQVNARHSVNCKSPKVHRSVHANL